MEILGRGEKIKRARIYKGLTLKQVCGDKISVSKLSCIENDKIEAEDEILEYIAEKLELDLDYLKQDVKEQLEENLNLLKDNKNIEGYGDKLQYNLRVAKMHGIYDAAFKFMHELFNYYIDNMKLGDIQLVTNDYYDLYQKSCNDKNGVIYYIDMCRYCFSNKEYNQAANYCRSVRDFFISRNDLKNHYLIIATYNEIACHVMLKNYKEAYEVSKSLSQIVKYEEDLKKKAEMYHMLALMSLRVDKTNFEKYKNKAYELYGDCNEKKAIAMYNYAITMFKINLKEEAIENMHNSIKYFPKYHKPKLVKFMLGVVEELLDNNVLDFSKEVCDEVLNYAIEVDKLEFIEQAYYYKSKILMRSKDYYQAEMYMNLSLDVLLKYGNNKQVHDRYLEMGNMYYNMENTKDALKYFGLAIKLGKNL